jgi:hypothetical protein
MYEGKIIKSFTTMTDINNVGLAMAGVMNKYTLSKRQAVMNYQLSILF